MSESEILKAKTRDKVGTRHARKLRMEGRIPASIPAHGEGKHVDFHISEHDFLATRRHHTHLYEIDIEGSLETAVVRELQWDTFGEHLQRHRFAGAGSAGNQAVAVGQCRQQGKVGGRMAGDGQR